MVEMAIFNIQRAITVKVGKQDTVHVFCMSSHGVNICVKFHENMSSCVKVMEKTQKLLRDTHTQKKENYIPHCMHTWYAGDITRVTIHVFCMSSYGLRFV